MRATISPVGRRGRAACAGLLGLSLAWGLTGASAVGAQEVSIEEWPVPWEASRPRDPFVDSAGHVWFVGQVGNYLAVFDPLLAKFQRFELDAGTGPHNLIVGANGTVWYAGNRASHIGALDPASGHIRRYDMPGARPLDPHTLVFDAAGDIWFTVQGGNRVGKLDTQSGVIRLVEVPTPHSRPYGIVLATDGIPWFAEFAASKLGWIDPVSFKLTEIELPRTEARPRRLAATSDGAIWYVDYSGGYLGRVDPSSGSIREWSIPGGVQGRPYAMAADDRDRLWFVETGPRPNLLVGFDPMVEVFFVRVQVPSGGGSVRNMMFDPKTGSLWFGTDANTLGRARVPE